MSVMLAITVTSLITDMRERHIKTVNKFALHDELPFPAVTICNLNQFNIDRVPDNPMVRYTSQFRCINKVSGCLGYMTKNNTANETV